MGSLFFFGTLCDVPLLQIVLGRAAGAELCLTPARLPDHAVTWVKDQPFAMIALAEGGMAEGLLVTGLDAADTERLDFYEGGFEYDRATVMVEVTVEADQGADQASVETQVYLPRPGRWTPGAPWSLGEWQAEWGALTRYAAQEVMDQFGRLSPAEMAFARPQIMTRASSWARARAHKRPLTHGSALGAQDTEMVARRRPYTKFFAVEEQDIRFTRFDGSLSEPVTRAAFVSGDAVTVLPYDPVRERVLLVEQFRFGPMVRGDQTPWSLEPVAGRIDPGETPQQAALREAREETGLDITRLEQIGQYYPSPGAITEYLFSYIGLADLPDAAAVIGGLDEEAEDIRGVLLSFDALMDMLHSGEAQNGPLILSALWLAANRERFHAG